MRIRESVLIAVLGIVLLAVVLAGDDEGTEPAPQPTPAPAPVGDLQGNPDLLRNTLPANVPKAVIERAEERVERLPDPKPRPTGGAQNYTFRTAFNGTPYGHAGGQKRLVVIHCTVGRNSSGWGDVLGTKSYLDRVGLSATWIADHEAHFLKTMPTSGNPYTQGRFFNQYAVSIELVSTCQESRAVWLASALFRERALASWLADRLREVGAPFRRVDPSGCDAPIGYTDHAALECINDHTDISFQCRNGGNPPRDFRVPPCAFPWDVLASQLADGPDAPNRKLAKWERSHRIAHARYRAKCRGHHAQRRAFCDGLVDRSARLHRLIAREHG
jgi:hypothetical protein